MSSDGSSVDSSAPAVPPGSPAPVKVYAVKGTPQKLAAALGKEATPSTPALAKRSPAPEGTPASATLKRALDMQGWTAELATDLAKWWVHVLPGSSMRGVSSADQFFEALQSGVELCDLINKIAPEYKLNVTRDAKPKSFQAVDNVNAFISAARSMGVNQVSLFEPDDLLLRKNDKLVVNTLLQLSEAAPITLPRVNISEELRQAFGVGSGAAKKGGAGAGGDSIVTHGVAASSAQFQAGGAGTAGLSSTASASQSALSSSAAGTAGGANGAGAGAGAAGAGASGSRSGRDSDDPTKVLFGVVLAGFFFFVKSRSQ